MTTQEKKKLIKLLKNASVTCHECGCKYGVPSVTYSTMWIGLCGICKQETTVTESRDYAYFFTTIRRLTLEVQNNVVD